MGLISLVLNQHKKPPEQHLFVLNKALEIQYLVGVEGDSRRHSLPGYLKGT